MIHGMRTTIDGAGRIVIPKAMRERLGLTGNQDVEIRERDGAIEIEPAATRMTLEERDGQLVAVPSEDLPPLTDDVVRATLDKTRR
jgi:AbrB family looped-hinge helix DNA binding protein